TPTSFVGPAPVSPRHSPQNPEMALVRRAADAHLKGRRAPAAPVQRAAVASSGLLQDVLESVARRKVGPFSGQALENTRLEDDLNLSSLDRVELMAAIENRYQVELSDREFSQAATVGDLENLVKKATPETRQPDYPYARWAQHWPITWIRTLAYHLVTLPYIMIMGRPKVTG